MEYQQLLKQFDSAATELRQAYEREFKARETGGEWDFTIIEVKCDRLRDAQTALDKDLADFEGFENRGLQNGSLELKDGQIKRVNTKTT